MYKRALIGLLSSLCVLQGCEATSTDSIDAPDTKIEGVLFHVRVPGGSPRLEDYRVLTRDP